MSHNQEQAADLAASSRRRLLMLLGAGGALGAVATVGAVGVASASGGRTLRAEAPDPTSYPTPGLTVILAVPDAGEARDFYLQAFSAQPLLAARDPEGRIFHAELLVNGVVLGLSTENPEAGLTAPRSGGQSAMWVTQFVPDLHTTVQKAAAAGAAMIQEPVMESDFLMRACLADPFGHNWQLFESLRSFTADELQQTVEEKLLGLA